VTDFITVQAPTRERLAKLQARYTAMQPTTKASEEREARLAAALKTGHPQSAETVTRAMRRALDLLVSHMAEFEDGDNRYMRTPADMLTYIDKTSLYITRDYKDASFDPISGLLFEAWQTIRQTVQAGQKASTRDSLKALLMIQSIAMTARSKRPAPPVVIIDDEGQIDDED
jgi:hypothetical protein